MTPTPNPQNTISYPIRRKNNKTRADSRVLPALVGKLGRELLLVGPAALLLLVGEGRLQARLRGGKTTN